MKISKLLSLFSVITLLSCSLNNGGVVEIFDIEGDKVLIKETPQRIVARTANATSFLVGMGLQEKVVGTMDAIAVNTWSNRFVSNIADIPSFPWEPSIESLYEVNADLVMLADPAICRKLRDKGITAITYKQYNEEEMLKSAELLSDIFKDKKDYIEKWLSYYEVTMDKINNHIKDIDFEDRPKVYYVYGQSNKGLYRSGGGETINTTMIELAGGRNVLRDASSSITKFNPEEVLSKDPEYVFIGGVYQNLLIDQMKSDELWKSISAVKNNNIYHIPLGFIPWDLYGLEFPLLLKHICHTLYKDFEFDLITETKEFISEFYNIEFTDTEISFMAEGLNEHGVRFF